MALFVAGGLAAQPVKPASSGPIFRELEDSGVDFIRFNGIAGDYLLPEITCAGAALLDFDRDGDLDLYLLQGRDLIAGRSAAKLTDRLYRNDLVAGEGGELTPRFVEVTTAAGLEVSGYGCGVAVGDYDRDGWADLYVANVGRNQLLRNRGDGTFADVTAVSGTDDDRWSVPVAWLDYDRDGWLDLYVGTYVEFEHAERKVCRSATGARDYCNPAAYAGEPDRLFRNRGDGTFEPRPLGSGTRPLASKSLGVVARDLNGDSRPDLYVTNDGVANQLWIQRPDGSFADQALLAGVALNGQGRAEASMGVAAGDVDGDGDLDLLMTHLVGETNTLYLNDGRGGFRDATVTTGLGPASWSFTGWGLAWIDYDNDGRLDVAIANGAVRAIQELVDRGEIFPFRQSNQLFHHEGGHRYSEVTAAAGPVFTRAEVSRALAAGDLDNDGDRDLVLVNIAGPARVLLNAVGHESHWLGMRPLGEAAGTGARLTRAAGPEIRRWSGTDGSFGAANDPALLFGLGAEPGRPGLRIYWPDGETELTGPLPVDRYLVFGKTNP